MSMTYWILFAGVLLIGMALAGTLLERLPLSGAMIYLGIGFLLGPALADLLAPDPFRFAAGLELLAQGALLISLFAVGIKLEVPLRDRRWAAPLRLAFVSMAITVALIAALGVFGLGLPLGAAVLLGGILAPTDPVLASGVQPEAGGAPDPVRFSLAGEGALNDGSAFPFVLLGLGLMGEHELGRFGWHWLAVDVAWALLGGMLIGALTCILIGSLVVFLRTHHDEALGLNEFVSLGTIAVCFGLAQLCHASGFLAVFAAGLALRRMPGGVRLASFRIWPPLAAQRHEATGATMQRKIQAFIEQMEKLAEPVLVIVTGAMLPFMDMVPGLWWFTAVLLVAVRPVAVFIGLGHAAVSLRRSSLIAWFGIRGIGSMYYLMYALNHGVSEMLAQQLVAFTLAAVTTSILLHGITASPLMRWYARDDMGRSPR
ncbi:cation:proton antiporter [Massilia endophytica]|uniref:cation:proton antiporter n=1 Tax=Massilia endophytica TaxID=2899220 RepID=UPI001E3C0186|nr:sodium:proton antiporter [Massilia endophytica]UGQ45877.1 sodium:proton antiporter [Massilia endophytica]